MTTNFNHSKHFSDTQAARTAAQIEALIQAANMARWLEMNGPPSERAAHKRAAKLCYDCGEPGKVYAPDERTLLCGRCWLERYEEARAC